MSDRYKMRPIEDLEPHYSRHVAAMTREKLHAKSDIAAELACRDWEIERLTTTLAERDKVASYRILSRHRQNCLDVCDEVERLTTWISVAEKMPADDVKVLSIGEDGEHVSFTSSGQWLREGDQDNFCLFGVTHWVPLPGKPDQTRQTSEFSRFIREGTPEEKAEVFERVIDESNKAQQDTIYKCATCGHIRGEGWACCPKCKAPVPERLPGEK